MAKTAVIDSISDYPCHLLFQWHITERCNLRCQHCYQESYQKQAELSLAQLEGILAQYKRFLLAPTTHGRRRIRGHINVTGGEPFARSDFPQLLELFAAHKGLFSFGILSNGSFIDREMARYLAALGTGFVQVSMEGTAVTHDQIRGQGNFDKVVTAIQHLVAAGVRTSISFTAHRQNFHEFPQVVRLGQKLGVERVWSDRLIPWGSGSQMASLTPEETQSYIELMQKTRRSWASFWYRRTTVRMGRALQFLGSGERPYRCTAGQTLVTVQANGDLVPCRRMPIPVGNLLHQDLNELYYQAPLLQKLRQPDCVSVGCEACAHQKLCRGGLKCLSYALTGDPFQADPGCWLAQRIPVDEPAVIPLPVLA